MTISNDSLSGIPQDECRKAFEAWASKTDPVTGYKNGNVLYYAHQFELWQAAWNTRPSPMGSLIDQLKTVAKTGFLPDGDGVNLSTQMWLEELVANARPSPMGSLVEKLLDAKDKVRAVNPALAGAQRIGFEKAIAVVKQHQAEVPEDVVDQATSRIRNAAAAMGIKLSTPHGSTEENAWQFAKAAIAAYEGEELFRKDKQRVKPDCLADGLNPSPAKAPASDRPSGYSVVGLSFNQPFNQQDVDNLIELYNGTIFAPSLQESLFRAIKACKERLRTSEPVIPVSTAPQKAGAIIEGIWNVWYGKHRGSMHADQFAGVLGEAKQAIIKAINEATSPEPVMRRDDLRKIVMALRNSQDAIENDIEYLAHAAGVHYVD